jgi:hypothetical protein
MSLDMAGGSEAFTADAVVVAKAVEADRPIRAVPASRSIFIVVTPCCATGNDVGRTTIADRWVASLFPSSALDLDRDRRAKIPVRAFRHAQVDRTPD